MKKLILFLIIMAIPAVCVAQGRVIVRIDQPATALIQQFTAEGYDIAAYHPDRYLDLVVSAEQVKLLTGQGLKLEIIQREESARKNMSLKDSRASRGYRDYQTLLDELQQLEQLYPDIFQLSRIGGSRGQEYALAGNDYYNSYNHDVWAIKLSDNVAVEEDEPSVFYFGTHHAREPISLEVTMAVLLHLLENYGTDQQVTDAINNSQIWFVPLVNPNGHRVVTSQLDTWWRKNIRDNNGNGVFNHGFFGSGADGVDPNRNYGYQWGPGGASSAPNDLTYHGPAPFSEPETQAIRDLFESHHFVAGITYHSYGELVLYPFGYDSETFAPDHAALQDLGVKMAQTIPGLSGTTYTPQASWELYPATGVTDDYTYGVHGAFTYTIELATEFIPPVTQIQYICDSNIEAAMILLNRVQQATVTGLVTDSATSQPVTAKIFVHGIDDSGEYKMPYTSDAEFGRYYRMLMPGTYTVTFSARGYESQTIEGVSITDSAQTLLDVALVSGPYVPAPDVTANGSDIPIRIETDDNVTLSVSMDTGDFTGNPAEWWVMAYGPGGWYSMEYGSGWSNGLNPCIEIPLRDLAPAGIYDGRLPAGDYQIIFAVDQVSDGTPDLTWSDEVNVHVVP